MQAVMLSIDLALYELPKTHVVFQRKEEQQVRDQLVAAPPRLCYDAS